MMSGRRAQSCRPVGRGKPGSRAKSLLYQSVEATDSCNSRTTASTFGREERPSNDPDRESIPGLMRPDEPSMEMYQWP